MVEGRWMQEDPILCNTGDPMSLNRYAYCGADPVMNADPTGMETVKPRKVGTKWQPHYFTMTDPFQSYPCFTAQKPQFNLLPLPNPPEQPVHLYDGPAIPNWLRAGAGYINGGLYTIVAAPYTASFGICGLGALYVIGNIGNDLGQAMATDFWNSWHDPLWHPNR